MTEVNKQVTAAVRSMARTLKTEHGIRVPHSALRAALLQAQGQHPHAFAGNTAKPMQELTHLRDLVQEAPNFFAPNYDFDGEKREWLVRAGVIAGSKEAEVEATLHLAYDEIGCFTKLSLTRDGEMLLPEDWQFSTGATVILQAADIPSVRRYGLPDSLANPSKFFQEYFGLGVHANYDTKVNDLGDDSGGSVSVQVRVPQSQWMELMAKTLEDRSELAGEVAEWVGLHYRKVFDTESSEMQSEWVHRYLTAQDAALE